MNKIELPEHLRAKLGPEMKMDIHWVDVKTATGGTYRGVVVRGGRYITGLKSHPNGEGTVPFQANDIVKIRRQAILPWWPFWN
ncbi:hypothetical protein [Desulfuromonas sp. AOP6]|uniref:hypothetical protein n=1 Tax=Desulfuromonas sp. AOP6 TaxID=1566351 RepID=UPI0012DBD2AC|nr:hypothetical protein [Desulfuromonas sp. AOP6]